PLGRDAGERRIARFDVDRRPPPLLRVVEAGLDKDVRQKRIVDLQQNTGVDNRAIFLVQLGGERMEILFVALVVGVDADARGRGRRQKHVMIGYAGRVGGGLYVGDVGLEPGLALVFHRPGANHRNDRQDGAAHHRFLEVLRIIVREGGYLLLEQNELLAGPRLETFEALADVGEEPRLRIFAVGDDLDAARDLLAHAVGDGLRQRRAERRLVVWLAGIFGLHEVEQAVRPRQAADMRGLD